jgi:hypothetical protein
MSRPSLILPMVLFYVVMISSGVVIVLLILSAKVFNLPLALCGAAVLAGVTVVSSIMLPEFSGAPWVPTRKEIVGKILTMSEVKTGDLLYDLGSGDGRLVIAASRDFGATAVGVEIDPFRVLYSRYQIWRYRLGNRARIIRRNFFDVELQDADVVVLFLLQRTNDKLQHKLEQELKKPDCRVVSLLFQFQGWEIQSSDEEDKIYVYRPHPAHTKE